MKVSEKIVNMAHNKRKDLQWIYAVLVVYCFAIMLFCTKSSPLFAFNDWFDANCYFTMGKGLMNGRVPYVDLIDNKGPLLFLIYGLAWLLGNTGFTGVYLFQCAFLALSVIYSYRLAALFMKRRFFCVLIAILSPIPMLARRFYALGFDYGGGGPEEICRALMIVSLYYYVFYDSKPEQYKPRHSVIQGVLFGCVFLMKFSLATFWTGFLAAILGELVLKKKWRQALRHIGGFVLGTAGVALPYVVYGFVTHSLPAFYDTYFLFNSRYTGVDAVPMAEKLIRAFIDAMQAMGGNLLFFALLLAGLVFIFLHCKKCLIVAYSSSLLLFLVVSFMAELQLHYLYIPITTFQLIGLVAVCVLVERKALKMQSRRTVQITAVSLVAAFTIGINGLAAYPLFLTDEQTTQQQMAKVIWQEATSDPITLLEIGHNIGGLDSGFYTAAGIIPQEPYFYIPNHISHDAFPTPRDAQKSAVFGLKTEFIISRSENNDISHNPYNLKRYYDEIAVLQGTGYQNKRDYHLFQLKPFVNQFDNGARSMISWIESSENPDILELMYDGDTTTRWHTGREQRPGDYILIAFDDAVDYNLLFMDVGEFDEDDYPRELAVSTSLDGIKWHNESLDDADDHYVQFEPDPYRYLKLTVNDSAPNWWSIYEIKFGWFS